MRLNRPALWLFMAILLGSFVMSFRSADASDTAAPSAAPPVDNDAARRGAELWRAFSCYACHGYEAQGGVSGPHLVDPMRPFEEFQTIVRQPYGSMPPYSPRILSDEQLQLIYAFLASK